MVVGLKPLPLRARVLRHRQILQQQILLQHIHKNEIDGMIAIGGDRTFRGISSLSENCDIPCICIPGTINNDTAESHNRIFVIEVMGRDSGYIGMYSGLTSGADLILIPECPPDLDLVSSKIQDVNSDIDPPLCKVGHIQRGGNPSAADRMLGIQLGAMAVCALIQLSSSKAIFASEIIGPVVS